MREANRADRWAMPPSDWYLLYSASRYNLTDRNERKRSNRELAELFFGLVDQSGIELFAEVGAFRADASLRIRRRAPACRVVAFEANPYNYQHFSSAIAYADRGIEYLNLAASDSDGEVTFRIMTSVNGEDVSRRVGRNSLLARKAAQVIYEEVTAKSVRLDSFFADSLAKKNAVWIDVEGAARMVLAGAQQFLNSTQVLMIEVEEKAIWDGQWLVTDIVEFLGGIGLIPVARDFESPTGHQYNLVFLRREAMALAGMRAAMIKYLGRPQSGAGENSDA